MTAEEAVDVFQRAVEAGHFADLEERLRSGPARLRNGVPYRDLVDAFRLRTAKLLDLDPRSTWVDGLLAQILGL